MWAWRWKGGEYFKQIRKSFLPSSLTPIKRKRGRSLLLYLMILWVWTGGPRIDTHREISAMVTGHSSLTTPSQICCPLYVSSRALVLFPCLSSSQKLLVQCGYPMPSISLQGFSGTVYSEGPPGIRTYKNSSPCVQMPPPKQLLLGWGSLKAKCNAVIRFASDLRTGRHGFNHVFPQLLKSMLKS